MNTPNKLTLARFILSAAFFAVVMIDFPFHYLISLIIFIVASLTDWLDGKIARSRGLITDFGKFLDPIADKMLTTAAFIAFTFNHIGAGIAVITFIVLAREFAVTSVRLVAADNGKVVAANMWGKSKTVMQMVAIIATLAVLAVAEIAPVSESFLLATGVLYSALLWIAGILTLIAGITYVVDNKEFINTKK